jgi:D-glycero-alpha-D-manno-heptose 1-phosphate guanylyltransferase
MECIVLAGGLGTRLQGVIGAIPKCMAPVAGQPFLFHVFQFLSQQKCTRVILSLGFKHEYVLSWLNENEWPFVIDFVIESTPLGTGGGISLALTKALEEQVVVLNGDTIFSVDLHAMILFHQQRKALLTLALKPLENFERYGVVRADAQGLVLSFEEKKYYPEGTINGGVYVIDRLVFQQKQKPEKYSFEQDFLEVAVADQCLYGYISNEYFIDIGVSKDYSQAQIDFAQTPNTEPQ